MKITSFTIAEKVLRNHAAKACLGYFDVDLMGLIVAGVMLARTRAGGFRLYPPTSHVQGRLTGVRFTDPDLQHVLLQEARATYKALGGRWWDWAAVGSPEREDLMDWFASADKREVSQ